MKKKNVFKSRIILSTFLDKNISKYIPFPTCTCVSTSEKKTLLSSSLLQVWVPNYNSVTYYTILNKILTSYYIPTKTQLFSNKLIHNM